MSKNTVRLIVFFELIFCTWFVESDEYKTSEEIKRYITNMKKVHTDGYTYRSVIEKMPRWQTVGRDDIIEMLVTLVREGKQNIIGLYGESGIGKTAVLRNLHKKLESNALGFDKILWVNVSTPVNKTEILNQIGRQVRVEYPNEASWRYESEHAKIVYTFSELRNKKFMLLMDGIPDVINLQEIGVPIRIYEKHNSKYVFTCRSYNVCVRMGAQKLIEVEPLSFEDSWILFCQKAACNVDNHSLDDPEICRLAKDICAQCHGVPKKLIDIGRVMASATTMAEWKRCLEIQLGN